ncbi:MAG: hypothetical protein QF561_05855 [Phycisphaerales bacterium]|jgi:hypothetical protein|nr:hypothetical protein [Phycisphaerales bacterium]
MKWSVTAVIVAAAGGSVHADYHTLCGWDDLVARVGLENVPTGDDVIVGQVEAPNGEGSYMPDASDPEFDGKYLIRRSGGPTSASSHATTVGKYYYGNDTSMASGVWFINCFEVNDWLQGGYLNVGTGSTPPLDSMGAQKIWSHSWVGSFGNTTYDHEALRRMDWVVDRDDVFVAVGLNNGTEQAALLSYGFNTVAVGRRDGDHAAGDVPAPYEGQGRMRPDICAPRWLTSEATPIISAAAAMLTEMVRDDDALPAEGEAAETLRAILMASADHNGASGADWTNNAPQDGPERGLTARPLDEVVGAGHLNVDRAHQIMSGGRTEGGSDSDAAGGATTHGWDLASLGPDDERWWRFSLPDGSSNLSVVAAWNRTVASNFGSYSLADVNIELFVVEGSDAISLIGDDLSFGGGNVASASEIDNVELINVHDLVPGTYLLRLQRADGSGGAVDVALAWSSAAETGGLPGDLNGDGFIGVDDLLQMLAAWGDCLDCEEDLNNDGQVNVDDLLLLLSLWS